MPFVLLMNRTSRSRSDCRVSMVWLAFEYFSSNCLYCFRNSRPLSVKLYLQSVELIRSDSVTRFRYFSRRLKLRLAWFMMRVLLHAGLAAFRMATIMLSPSRFLPKYIHHKIVNIRSQELVQNFYQEKYLSDLFLTEADKKNIALTRYR